MQGCHRSASQSPFPPGSLGLLSRQCKKDTVQYKKQLEQWHLPASPELPRLSTCNTEGSRYGAGTFICCSVTLFPIYIKVTKAVFLYEEANIKTDGPGKSVWKTKPQWERVSIFTLPLPFHLGSLAGVGDGRYVVHDVFTGFGFPSSTLPCGNSCARLNTVIETNSKLISSRVTAILHRIITVIAMII